MLENVLSWVVVFLIGGVITTAAGLIFVYFLWAMTENETDRSGDNSLWSDKKGKR